MEWSNSRLTRVQKCGEAFRRSEIEKDREPTSPQAIRGSVVHQVAKVALRRKIGRDNHALPTVDEAKDLAADLFESRWRDSDVRLMVPEEDGGETLRQARGEAKDLAIQLAGHHIDVVAPTIDPIAVERQIIVRPKNSDLVIHGTLDVVSREPEDVEAIRDTKTSRKPPSKDAADKSQQLTMYGLVRLAASGVLSPMRLDNLWMTPKQRRLEYRELKTTRDQEDFEALVHRINVATQAVERGVFLPADPASAWWCSPKWCGYWDSCPYVRRSKRPLN